MDEKVEALEAELQHVKEENNALRLRLEVQSSNYKNLQSYLQEIDKNRSGYVPNLDTNKRARLEEFATAKKPLQVFVRTHPKDDSLIVSDGYHWRKYGQKVTKDNASPRAYFRCSMAPTCPAKKKVQRCVHDRSIIVATYDEEHNHGAFHDSFLPSSSTSKGSMANSNLPLRIIHKDKEALNIEEHVSSLIKDPEFTVALAEAIAHSIIGQPKQQCPNLNLGLPEE